MQYGTVSFLINLGDCSCTDHISENGFGYCKKYYKNGPICYVKQPSSCGDLILSTTEEGKQYSWEACIGTIPTEPVPSSGSK